MSGARVVKRMAVAVVLVLSACGVSSQDEPQPIEESTSPPAPSFDNETSPPPSTTSTSVPPG